MRCLRENHQIRPVGDITRIAHRKTSPLTRRPHIINDAGIGRKSCGCTECQCDRNELGCKNPGKCIAAAEIILDAIYPKWNPTRNNGDLCEDLALTTEELERNQCGVKGTFTFDPDFRLKDISHGLRIFGDNTGMRQIGAKRYRRTNLAQPRLTVFIHVSITRPNADEAQMKVMILDDSETVFKDALALSFTTLAPRASFSTALLGRLLWVIQSPDPN
ncbi:hypothetical protein C8R45DRAFT_837041 [Mycena sanguinolenta]|nr:hypothetical protein C8R45DRAFT_837041 [Mycena sanguinolenta]